jgi:tRNA modification GTPase
VVLVLDRSSVLTPDDRTLIAQTATKRRVVVANKIDLPPAAWSGALDGVPLVPVSAVTGEGIEDLRGALASALVDREPQRDVAAVTNLRHVDLLERARAALLDARRAAVAETPEEFVLADVGEARARLEEVTGARTSEDVLRAIFQRFCIGK